MIIEAIKERVVGKKPKVSRAEVLAARPVRNPAVAWAHEKRNEESPLVAVLQVPRRRDKWGNLVARWFKLPESRKLELDEIGSDVWELCDGTYTVEAVTKAVCTKYRLNRRQGETSVTAYLRMLAERRLVALRIAKPAGTSGKAPVTKNRTKRRKNKPAGAAAQ